MADPLERLIPWMTLRRVSGVGNLLFRRLLDRFSSPEAVLASDPPELGAVEGVGPGLAERIAAARPGPDVLAELDLLAASPFHVLVLTDPDYPRLLREIPDPPSLLYVHGNAADLSRAVAVVGSRTPTRYGLANARRLSADLAGVDIIVISGMARGIDTAAHLGALDAGGRTVAVLGSGLNRVYPPENREIYRRIAASGAVISEFPLDAPPEAHHFPTRNRIISGLSLGTVVVEASRKSGSLITARLALEQGREIFAVPGHIRSLKSTGAHSLIRQGAVLVQSVRDILAELGPLMKSEAVREVAEKEQLPAELPPLTAAEETVFRILTPYPVHIDELVDRLGMPPSALSAALLQLELKSLAARAPGNLFSLAAEYLNSAARI